MAVAIEVTIKVPRLSRNRILPPAADNRVLHAVAEVGATGIKDRVPIVTGQLLSSVELPRLSTTIFIRAPYTSNVNAHSSSPRFIERMMSETVAEQNEAAELQLQVELRNI